MDAARAARHHLRRPPLLPGAADRVDARASPRTSSPTASSGSSTPGILTRGGTAVRGQRARFSLTEAGIQTLPIICALGDWGLDWSSGSDELRARQQFIRDEGPAFIEELMDELRVRHLDAPPKPLRRPGRVRAPRGRRRLRCSRLLIAGQPPERREPVREGSALVVAPSRGRQTRRRIQRIGIEHVTRAGIRKDGLHLAARPRAVRRPGSRDPCPTPAADRDLPPNGSSTSTRPHPAARSAFELRR